MLTKIRNSSVPGSERKLFEGSPMWREIIGVKDSRLEEDVTAEAQSSSLSVNIQFENLNGRDFEVKILMAQKSIESQKSQVVRSFTKLAPANRIQDISIPNDGVSVSGIATPQEGAKLVGISKTKKMWVQVFEGTLLIDGVSLSVGDSAVADGGDYLFHWMSHSKALILMADIA